MTPQKTINFNVISEAFDIVKSKWQPFVVAGLMAFGAIFVVEMVFYGLFFMIGLVSGSRPGALFAMFPLMAVLFIAIFLIQAFTQAGFASISIKAVKGEAVESTDFLAPLKTPMPYLAAAALVTLASLAGMIACFIGVYVMAGLTMFVFPLMVDRKLSPMDALKASIEILKPQWLMATCFYFVACFVGGIGAIACGIGIVFTLPITYLAVALCYRDLAMDPADFPSKGDANPSAKPVDTLAAERELDNPAVVAEPEAPATPESEPEPPKD